MCGSTCKRKTGERCEACRRPGGQAVLHVGHEERGKRRHAAAQEIGAAVDMYFDGLSYRKAADNIGDYFGPNQRRYGLPTGSGTERRGPKRL